MGENVQNQDSTLNFTHNINYYPKIVFDINLFLITQYNSYIYNIRIFSRLTKSPHIRKAYLYEHLRRLKRQILKIDEVITGVLLSIETSVSLSTKMSPSLKAQRH